MVYGRGMKASFASALVPVVALCGIALLSAASTGCPSPRDGRPVARCFDDCRARASARCEEQDCDRGCKFILDRVVEREDAPVIACVAAASACGDEVWANCASRVGIHLDGGPPLPPSLSDEPGSAGGEADSLDDEPAKKPEKPATEPPVDKTDKPKTPPAKPAKPVKASKPKATVAP